MNLHLSEAMSWVLEPVANVLEGSAEVVSNEDLKSRMDRLNEKYAGWVPDEKLVGSLMEQEEMLTASSPSQLCDCQRPGCDQPGEGGGD